MTAARGVRHLAMVGDCEREDERQERIRVLLVGEPEAVPELDPLGEDEEMLTVGRVVGAEEVAPAVDSLQPHVLVLGSTLLQMAFRMATCPAAVVVVPDQAEDEGFGSTDGSRSSVMKLALLLAAARP